MAARSAEARSRESAGIFIVRTGKKVSGTFSSGSRAPEPSAVAERLGTQGRDPEYPPCHPTKPAVWPEGMGIECGGAIRIARRPAEPRATPKSYLTPFSPMSIPQQSGGSPDELESYRKQRQLLLAGPVYLIENKRFSFNPPALSPHYSPRLARIAPPDPFQSVEPLGENLVRRAQILKLALLPAEPRAGAVPRPHPHGVSASTRPPRRYKAQRAIPPWPARRRSRDSTQCGDFPAAASP